MKELGRITLQLRTQAIDAFMEGEAAKAATLMDLVRFIQREILQHEQAEKLRDVRDLRFKQ